MIGGTVLHPGCGREPLPNWLSGAVETRLDIDKECNPDVCASIVDMGEIGQFDHVYTSHTLEHLYQYQVGTALKEFLRVLKPGGDALIFVPDVEGVTCNREVCYESLAGPICGLDLYYGLTSYVEQNNYYAHHTAFVKETLAQEMKDAGFVDVSVKRMMFHNLFAYGKKPCSQ